MNRRERFNRTMHFQGVDRVINLEFGYWDKTIERWHREGLPQNCKPIAKPGTDDRMAPFFNLDIHWLNCFVSVNNVGPIPAYEENTLEEDAETRTIRSADGIVMRVSKTNSSVPHHISFPVKSRQDFDEYKLRFNPNSTQRYPDNWTGLVNEYRNRDYPLGLNMNGFFGQLRNWMGFENIAYAWYDQPDLIAEMCQFWADFNIAAARRVFAETELDFVHFWEDMAFNHGSMVSPFHFQKFMAPSYKKVIDFIKSQGIDIIIVDSDGLIEELIPLFLEVGINCILPVEVAAGGDPVAIRKKYGNQLRMLGGIDKRVLALTPEKIEEELRSKLPLLLSAGGYVPVLDHLVPPDVPLANYQFYLKLKRELIASP